MRTFFNIYRNILLVIAVFLAMVMILPLAFQVKPYIVLSPSMEPTIHTGDVCYIQKYAEDEKPEIGSIVAFVLNDNETIFVHRVVDIKDDTYITQGDANDSVDLCQPTESSIVGKAVFVIPYLGTIVSWVKSSQGLVIMGVAVLISILSSFLDAEKREDDEDNVCESAVKEEVSVFAEKYKEVKKENKSKEQTLSALIKERQAIREEMIRREQQEWVEDFFEKDFEEITSSEEENNNNFNQQNNSTEHLENDKEIELSFQFEEPSDENINDAEKNNTENKESENNNEDDVIYDFDNLSVEEETRKLFEKHSVIALEDNEKLQEVNYLSIAKVGLNSLIDEDIEKVESEDVYDVSEYTKKYLGPEASDITTDTLLFGDNVKDWSFMVDDKEDSEFTERYKKSVSKSVKRKLESNEYNDSDNFSPASILKRAHEALDDDLTAEENEIINALSLSVFGGFEETDENVIASADFAETIEKENKIELVESGEAEVISDEIIDSRLINDKTKTEEKPE